MVEKGYRIDYWASLFQSGGSLEKFQRMDRRRLDNLIAQREGGEIIEEDFWEQCRRLVETSISDQMQGIEAIRDLF